MRPRKPKDKNFVENALGVFWRWSRRRLRYTFGEWRTAKVHPDCHVQVGKNFYSVPYQLRGKDVEVRVSSGLVEAFSKLECVARHLRAHANAQGRYVTSEAHLPEAHLAIREATPQMAVSEAAAVGPATESVVRALVEKARHPLMYLRRVQGILCLVKRYSTADLEGACETLVRVGVTMPRLSDVEAIIKSNIDPRSAAVIPMRRGPNPFLRGQETRTSTTSSTSAARRSRRS